MIIEKRSYPRAALIGNPSDGYYGKTIAFVFSNFYAEVVLYQTPELEILPQERDRSIYPGIKNLYEDVQLFGYYGGIRLMKATIKRFYEYCREHRIVLDNRNFTVRYHSTIPKRLGLAGSSAIITAMTKALMVFYRIKIPPPLLANLVLSVETVELGIGAGLQDRVAQAYEHPVFMDFSKSIMDKHGFGKYETFDHRKLQNVYIAFRTDLSEGSEVFHNNIRARFNNGDPQVVNAMQTFAHITERAKACIEKRDFATLNALMNENFDLRASMYRIDPRNIEMVELARSVGPSAKFTGSGGAIIGLYADEKMFEQLTQTMNVNQIEVIKPKIVFQA